MKRHRLTTRQREDLYDREVAKAVAAGRGNRPVCNLCNCPIYGRDWHESHNKYLPHALGGEVDGIAHVRCNLEWNNIHDTPLVAKVKRVRQKNIGAWRSKRPMPFGRFDKLKQKIGGEVVERATGLPWRAGR